MPPKKHHQQQHKPIHCIICDLVQPKQSSNLVTFDSLRSIPAVIDSVNKIRAKQKENCSKPIELLGDIPAKARVCSNCVKELQYYGAKKKVQSVSMNPMYPSASEPLVSLVYDEELDEEIVQYEIPLDPESISNDPNSPDLSYYRQGEFSQYQCTFGCPRNLLNPAPLTTVSPELRHELLMNYKFYTESDTRMCTAHQDTQNWWPLVKQITRQATLEVLCSIVELQHQYYHEKKMDQLKLEK